jgi:hypothetical protein
LDGQDPNIFEQVLQYLYTDTYDGRCAVPATSEPSPNGVAEQNQSSHNDAGEAMTLDPDDAASDDSDDPLSTGPFDVTDSELLTHMHVYALAGFLQISGLQKLAFSRCQSIRCSDMESERDAITKVLTGNCSIKLKLFFINTYVETIAYPGLSGYFREREPLAWSLAQCAKFLSNKVKQQAKRVRELEEHLVQIACEANIPDYCDTKHCPAQISVRRVLEELKDVRGIWGSQLPRQHGP